MSTPLITPELVSLGANLGSTKTEVITSVAGLIAAAGRADADGLAHDALDRESKSPTGMPGGFAIPHCRSAAVSQVSLGFARLSPAVDFNGPDGPADLICNGPPRSWARCGNQDRLRYAPHRRHYGLSHRHRPHLHGRRLPEGCWKEAGC